MECMGDFGSSHLECSKKFQNLKRTQLGLENPLKCIRGFDGSENTSRMKKKFFSTSKGLHQLEVKSFLNSKGLHF